MKAKAWSGAQAPPFNRAGNQVQAGASAPQWAFDWQASGDNRGQALMQFIKLEEFSTRRAAVWAAIPPVARAPRPCRRCDPLPTTHGDVTELSFGTMMHC